MSYFTDQIDFADKFCELISDHRQWSEATFGADNVRGPLGPLKHLEKEAREAQAAVCLEDGPERFAKVREELADCFLLILDAARRAKVKPTQLVEAAQAKLLVNKMREWPSNPPTDDAIEHIEELAAQ